MLLNLFKFAVLGSYLIVTSTLSTGKDRFGFSSKVFTFNVIPFSIIFTLFSSEIMLR